jgi:hypothetical protein
MLLIIGAGASAQSTIFNIPSTEVMSPKKIYIEADFIAHFDKYSLGGFQTYGYRTVYGVNRKFEAGVNFFYTRNGSTSPKEIQLNAKYQVYNNEKNGLAASVGGWTFTEVNRSSNRRTSGMVYVNGSKKFNRLNGLRVTAGVYQLLHTERDSGSKKGWIVGIEQPIIGKLSFAGDWFSGNNRFGYAAAGLSYTFGRRHYFLLGYNWGNTGRGNNGFSAFYGLTF